MPPTKETIQLEQNNNINKTSKRKDTKQPTFEQVHVKSVKSPRKGKFLTRLNPHLPQNNKATLSIQHKKSHILHKNKKTIRTTKVRLKLNKYEIQSKPAIDKTPRMKSIGFYGKYLLFFNIFYLLTLLNFKFFVAFFK